MSIVASIAAIIFFGTAMSLQAFFQGSSGEEIVLTTKNGSLYGTLLLPDEQSSSMPVVFIHPGSGPTDRDGNSAILPGKNNSLQQLAEGLASHGIASVRIDKRKIGKSAAAQPASEADLRFDDYVDDVKAWAVLLRNDKRFSSLFLLGHSEGALITLAAANDARVTGYISVAGVGSRADSLILQQLRQQLPPGLLAAATTALKSLANGETTTAYPKELETLFRPSVQPYLISWMKYSPQALIASLTMPVLIAQGSADIQVPTEEAKKLHKALPAAEMLLIQDMNHVLKVTGSDMAKQQASYSSPTPATSDELIKGITDFVKKHATK